MPVMLSGDEDPGTQENGEGMGRLSNDSPRNPSQRQNASLPHIPILRGDQQTQLLAGWNLLSRERKGRQLRPALLKQSIPASKFILSRLL